MASNSELFHSQFRDGAVTHDMHKLVARLGKLATHCPTALNRTVTRTADAVQRSLVKATPVDTGFARSNWQMGVNQIPTGNVNHLNSGMTQGANKSIMGQFRSQRGDKLYLVSNVSYIDKLNAGSSQQQPVPMFVERAVSSGVFEVNAITEVDELVRRIF